MIPKEKAKELYDKFRPFVSYNNGFGYDKELEGRNTKSCCQLCIQEIIEVLKREDDVLPLLYSCYDKKYWDEVLTAINEL